MTLRLAVSASWREAAIVGVRFGRGGVDSIFGGGQTDGG
jgi:hypothetical protein